MTDQVKSITETTLIPLSLAIAVISAAYAIAGWHHDQEENTRRIAVLERRVDGFSTVKDDLASIKYKVDQIRVDVHVRR